MMSMLCVSLKSVVCFQRAALSAPRILRFSEMNAKYKMSLLGVDSASHMSSLLLYNYLLTFTDSDSCESLKDSGILPLQLPRNRPKIHLV